MLRKLLTVVGFMTLFASAAMAADGEAVYFDKYASMAAALAIGLAAFGGSLGQAKAAAAALEGIARNPSAQKQIFVPLIISLALIESLVLYAFIIALVKIRI
ncbi:MAG: ATP synthase F0 subunit C [Cryobacterium sp.]|nr:ATP synthase F0 subunit C [Oligoflexia bacterium]